MGNQLEKEYNIKERPMKLPGSYCFLRFIHHPTQDLSLVIVKNPHKATTISSTLILPIKQIQQLSNDSVAICHKCLPLALVKPKSETQMRILMHKILKSGTEIGRCFFYMGRIMLWCEEKRGVSCMAPEQMEHGKPHAKSNVFVSGIALINFLHCVYEGETAPKRGDKTAKKQNSLKSTKSFTQSRIDQKLKEKGSVNETLPQEVKLFFQPKDRKEYYESYYTMEARLIQTSFWNIISEGLRELLLNMISEDPEKRIDLENIVNIPYFMESYQLRLYSTLSDDLEGMSPKEAKIFMTTLELLVKEGLTIEQCLMQDYFLPVLCSMVIYNPNEGKQTDYLLPMVLSILLEVDKPPIDIICTSFKKSHARNIPALRLALSKKIRLLQLLPSESFDAIMSRALFSSFESELLIELAMLSLPFAIRNIKQTNYRKEIEFLLVNKVLMPPGKENVLLDGLKQPADLARQTGNTDLRPPQIRHRDQPAHPLPLRPHDRLHTAAGTAGQNDAETKTLPQRTGNLRRDIRGGQAMRRPHPRTALRTTQDRSAGDDRTGESRRLLLDEDRSHGHRTQRGRNKSDTKEIDRETRHGKTQVDLCHSLIPSYWIKTNSTAIQYNGLAFILLTKIRPSFHQGFQWMNRSPAKMMSLSECTSPRITSRSLSLLACFFEDTHSSTRLSQEYSRLGLPFSSSFPTAASIFSTCYGLAFTYCCCSFPYSFRDSMYGSKVSTLFMLSTNPFHFLYTSSSDQYLRMSSPRKIRVCCGSRGGMGCGRGLST